MILREMFKEDTDYVCELTKLLDSKLKSKYFLTSPVYKRGVTYIYDPIWSIERGFVGKGEVGYILGIDKNPQPKDHVFIPIRRPGRTIGSIKVNAKLVIESIEMDTDIENEFNNIHEGLDVYKGRRLRIVSSTDLVFSKTDQFGHYVSELTEDMDTYLLDDYPKDIFEYGYTYLDYSAEVDQPKGEMVYSIRTPGATRAILTVDTATLEIKELKILEDKCVDEYREEVKEICNKYVGKKLIIIGGMKNE